MSEHLPLALPTHEVLAKLAAEDPAAYEALRRKLIESFIDSAPARLKPRLQGVQFRIDSMRRLSRSALGATLKIYAMMWKSFQTLNGHLQDVALIGDNFGATPGAFNPSLCQPVKSAQILRFRRPGSGGLA